MVITDHEKKQAINNIVNDLAGCPTELQKQLNKIGFRYVKVRRGGLVKYIVREIKGNLKHTIKL